MVDRAPTKPNRYAVYDDNHNFIRYEYHERADEPTEAGDALNKANLLPDDVATALGLTGNPQVAHALEKLSGAVNPLQYVWDKYQTIENLSSANRQQISGLSTSSATTTIRFGDTFDFNGTSFSIKSPTTIQLSYDNYAQYESALKNKYFITDYSSNYLYKGGAGTVLQCAYESNWYRVYATNVQTVTVSETYIGQIVDYLASKYPQNNLINGYRYQYIGRPQYIDTKIAVGSYTGTGTYGSGSKNSLTLDFAPKKISIINSTGIVFGELIINGSMVYGYSYSGSFVALTGSISGNTISWYAADAAKQLNASGVSYLFVVEG